jgi:hypothetical protein
VEQLCILRAPYRGVISGTRLESVSSVRESVKTGLEPEDRGIAIFGAVIRKRLLAG